MNNRWLKGCAALLAALFVVGTGFVAVPAAQAQGGTTVYCVWVPAQNAWVVDNTADISPLRLPAIVCVILDDGNIIVTNAGALTTSTTSAEGVYASTNAGDVRVENGGAITTRGDGAEGIYARTDAGDVSVENSGAITTSSGGTYGIRARTLAGDVRVANSGVITTSGDGADGIFASTNAGDVRVANSGVITTSGDGADGIFAGTNDGVATVVNSGAITTRGASSVGIQMWDGNDIVTNSGDITAKRGSAIDTGAGKDTVIIQGGTITGLIDGGDDWDRLAFSAVLDPASYEGLNAELQAQLASADPTGGTITFRGESYTYANFEELLNWLVLAMLHDGRINPFDFAATATGWCAGGGAQFYAIHADGTGEWAYNVTDGQVQVALAQAFATGQHVLIADRLGVQLWALADRSAEGVDQLQLMGPDYLTIFPANTCGFTD